MPSNDKQVILITGASSGFGYFCALRLAACGHAVYATMRDTSKSIPLKTEADKRNCLNNLHVLSLDVTKPETISQAISDILAVEGCIDVLINNAGFGMAGFFEDITPAEFQEQFDVNFFGVLNVTRHVLPAMRLRKKGKIINISSMASFVGTPCFSAYCSSKWALEGFSECLHMELKPFGIDVILVEPGSYRTKIFEQNARVGSSFFRPDSPYYSMSRSLKQLIDHAIINNKKDPNAVALVIDHIVHSQKPSFRNIVGWEQKLRYLVVRCLPFKIYAWIVNRILLSRSKTC